MASEVTVSHYFGPNGFCVTDIHWVADDAVGSEGEVAETLIPEMKMGRIVAVDTLPDVVAAPSVYMVNFKDTPVGDILGGAGTGRSATAWERLIPKIRPGDPGMYGDSPFKGPLTFIHQNNTEAAAKGDVRVFWRRL